MKSLSDRLPPEIAQRLHPDWRKNEADYWANRDQLVSQYCLQWIAFANGGVMVSGTSPLAVLQAAQASGQHPFVTRVGREDEPWCRMRRVVFPYDSLYPSEALPVMPVEFRTQLGSPGLVVDRVIPDTGADASAVPWSDCQQLGLDPGDGAPVLMGGVGQTTVLTIVFWVWAHLDGNDYRCHLQADFTGVERILGRDVLNQLDVLFRGPTREVVINP
jgi:hypothetical protein